MGHVLSGGECGQEFRQRFRRRGMGGDFLPRYGYRRRREARGFDFFDRLGRRERGNLWGSRRQRAMLCQTLPPQSQFLRLPAQRLQIIQARSHFVPSVLGGDDLDEGLPGPEMGDVLTEDLFEVLTGEVPSA
jgi:hypothetical protein